MIAKASAQRHIVNVGLLGPSFDTANRGVSALTESSIKCILNQWPNARVTLLAGGRKATEYQLKLLGQDVQVRTLPIRFCKNVFLPNHFCVFLLYALLLKVIPWKQFRTAFAARRPYLKEILAMDVVADITAGDSFSDMYGISRFLWVFLLKWLIVLFGKELILLPQTYGPFNKRITRILAKHILKRASLIYSRDQAGIEYVNTLLNNRQNGKVRFAPDVAFVLDAREPRYLDIEPSADIRRQNSMVVGLNISGLLFNGGYTRDNMFGLRTNYHELISGVINFLCQNDRLAIILVPHVFAPIGDVESDTDACLQVYNGLKEKYKGMLFLVQGEYDHNEIKHIIGMCDFFIGSRMHACIAALSQRIPAVGIAYSKKFSGVFESIGLADCVADVYRYDADSVLETVESAFGRRELIRRHLESVVPRVQQQILNIFEGFYYHGY